MLRGVKRNKNRQILSVGLDSFKGSLTDRLLRLLGEEPDAPVDLIALIANGQTALNAVFATVLSGLSDESPKHMRVSQTRHTRILG